MSRVRIYELAKEVGMGSKELTDKLIGLGFDVKGPSSTVDDTTAAKIRGTIVKKSGKDTGDRHAKAGAVAPLRRPTVILRKARTDEPTAAEEGAPLDPDAQPTIEAPAGEPAKPLDIPPKDQVRTARVEQYARIIRTPPVMEMPSKRPVEKPVVAEEESPVVTGAESQPVTASEVIESAHPLSEVVDADGNKGEAPVAEVESDGETKVVHTEPQMTIMPKRPEKRKFTPPPLKKGIARVVGTIELPASNDSAGGQLRKRPVKPVVAKKERTDKVNEVVAPTQDDASRHKKKGRRGPETEEERDRRLGKGVKKGQKNLKFTTHFTDEYQRSGGKRGKKLKGRGDDGQLATAEMKASKKRIKVFDTISVGELASKMRVKASEVIAKLMGLGVMATMNQAVDVDTAMLIATDFGYEIEQGITEERGFQLLDESEEGGAMMPRSPVVTVMGHVVHG